MIVVQCCAVRNGSCRKQSSDYGYCSCTFENTYSVYIYIGKTHIGEREICMLTSYTYRIKHANSNIFWQIACRSAYTFTRYSWNQKSASLSKTKQQIHHSEDRFIVFKILPNISYNPIYSRGTKIIISSLSEVEGLRYYVQASKEKVEEGF